MTQNHRNRLGEMQHTENVGELRLQIKNNQHGISLVAGVLLNLISCFGDKKIELFWWFVIVCGIFCPGCFGVSVSIEIF